MLSSFTHIAALQHRTATGYKTDRVAAGMRINAEKSFLHAGNRVPDLQKVWNLYCEY
jgi:hypothetical protein